MKAAAKAISAFRCAKYSFDKDPRNHFLVELENAQNFSEWLEAAQQLDKLSGAIEWRMNPESDLYEWAGLAEQVSRLRMARLNNDISQLMFLLQLSCSRHFCGISNPQLYTQALSGTKYLIEEFTNEVCQALELVCSFEERTVSEKTGDRKSEKAGDKKITTEQKLHRFLQQQQQQQLQQQQQQQSDYQSSSSDCTSIEEELGLENVFEVSEVSSRANGADDAPEQIQKSLEKFPAGICCSSIDESPTSHSEANGLCQYAEFPGVEFGPDDSTVRRVKWGNRSFCVRDQCVQTDPLIADYNNRSADNHRSAAAPYPIEAGTPWANMSEHEGEFAITDPSSPADSIEKQGKNKENILAMKRYSNEFPSYCSSTSMANSPPFSNTSSSVLRPSACDSLQQSEAAVDCPYHDFPSFSPRPLTLPTNTRREASPPSTSLVRRKSATTAEQQQSGCDGYAASGAAVHSLVAHQPLMYQSNSHAIRMKERLKFLITLRLSLGRTALCLSGGGALAMYHMGIIKALLDQQCLPKVISGTSGGSIVAGILAIATEKELSTEVLRPEVVQRHPGFRWFPPVSAQVQRFFLKGQMVDEKDFQQTCKAYYGDYTFKDAFLKTGRLVNIVVSPASRTFGGEALILNHINTPDVFLWSAVTASCSLPGLLLPHELMVRGVDGSPYPYCPTGLKWMDGSITQDLPIKELARLFNVKQFIVSQVNPHHAPFVKVFSGTPWMQEIENWLTLDIKNRYAKLAKFNMIPRIFGQDISSFWMIQAIEGHVTITPRASLIDWYRMINQPSLEDMEDFIIKGQQRVWPHLPRVMQILKTEQTLRRCWADLTRTLRSSSSQCQTPLP